MPKTKRMKKWTAMSISLRVKKELAAKNGCTQFYICVKAPTKKRVSEILESVGCYIPVSTLTNFYGLCSSKYSDEYSGGFEPPLEEVIYFYNENLGTPHYNEWLCLNDWLR